VTWEETETPFLPVGRLEFPAQVFTSPAQDAFCENLEFNAWRITSEHRPLGGLNRVRKALYAATAARRLELNNARAPEPTGDEVFP
jgi:hypothetical protein